MVKFLVLGIGGLLDHDVPALIAELDVIISHCNVVLVTSSQLNPWLANLHFEMLRQARLRNVPVAGWIARIGWCAVNDSKGQYLANARAALLLNAAAALSPRSRKSASFAFAGFGNMTVFGVMPINPSPRNCKR